MNKTGKKLGIFRSYYFINCTFTLASHNASAEETKPAVSVTGKFADTITIVNVSNNERWRSKLGFRGNGLPSVLMQHMIYE